MSIQIDEFKRVLPLLCDKETSLASGQWSAENPFCGHCAVVSLVAQNLFGGDLLRASLENTVFAAMRSYYWNKLPDGSEVDFTKPQFKDAVLSLEGVVRERSYVLSFPETKFRYQKLALRLAKKVQLQDTVDDKIYEACFYAALDSPCQKLRFGCVAVKDGGIVASGCNKTIEPLKHLCEPTCIRMGIQSRTESMIGACGHAEEFVIYSLVKKGIPLNECDFFVAGVFPNGLPIPEDNTDYSCLRCGVQMYNAGVRSVAGPMNGVWIPLPMEQALKSAVAYALKQKKA
ncbi:hypothetical protein HY485_05140 [Candidatus Woesearchaeota archaeon]|nr:hypothetical protein [Candidatus Woesearchaeota archaeon]